MKYCIHCRHHNIFQGAVCLKTETPDMVTGEKQYRSCQETRDNPVLCGKDASWFEPRESPKPVE